MIEFEAFIQIAVFFSVAHISIGFAYKEMKVAI